MAYDFDGVNDRINHTDINALDGTANMTVMCWVFIDTLLANGAFLAKSTGANTTFGFGMGSTNTFLQFSNNGNPAQGSKTGAILSTGSWFHAALAYNGGGATSDDKAKIYFNSVDQGPLTHTSAPPATLNSNTGTFSVCADDFPIKFTDAKIGHIKVWNVTLTASEIAQEMWQIRPVKKSGLILWAPYFEQGTAAADYSGSGFDGTVTEAVLAAGPPGVSWSDPAILDPRNQRARRFNIDPIRRLGPSVPLYTRGV